MIGLYIAIGLIIPTLFFMYCSYTLHDEKHELIVYIFTISYIVMIFILGSIYFIGRGDIWGYLLTINDEIKYIPTYIILFLSMYLILSRMLYTHIKDNYAHTHRAT